MRALICLALLIGSCGAAQAEPPLFVAFKRICLAGDGSHDAMRNALRAEGGTLIHPLRTINPKYHVTEENWTVPVQGRVVDVSFSTAIMTWQDARKSQDSCSVREAGDQKGAAAIMAWAGVPDSAPRDPIRIFEFKQAGGAHVTLSPGGLWSETGEVFVLIVDNGSKTAAATLHRDRAIAP